MTGFTEDNITNLFQIKEKIKSKIGNNGRKYVEILVLSKYLNNFWKNLEMPLINCEFNVDLNWSKNCIIVVTDVAN